MYIVEKRLCFDCAQVKIILNLQYQMLLFCGFESIGVFKAKAFGTVQLLCFDIHAERSYIII